MRTRKTSITSKAIAPNRTKRSHAGVCPRPVGKMNPSAMTRPPSITKRLVSQPARPAIVAPAGPSATAEDVTLPVSPASALPAPISTITHPTAFSGRRMTSSAPTEANVTPRNSKPTSARSVNPSASGIERDGIDDAERDRADRADQCGYEPADGVWPCQRPHQRSHRPMREGAIASPTVLCRSSRTVGRSVASRIRTEKALAVRSPS